MLVCGDNLLQSLIVSRNLALDFLKCNNNEIVKLDITQNEALTLLDCSFNHLSSLNLSNNSLLSVLDCDNARLNTLDVLSNTLLSELGCSNIKLSRLEVSKNPELVYLSSGGNQLTSLDLSYNHLLGTGGQLNYDKFPGIFIQDMPALYEVCVWTSPFPPDNTNIDTTGSPNVNFTTECPDTDAPGITINSQDQHDSLIAISTENGTIYLVPVDTEKDLAGIRAASIDSAYAIAAVPVVIPTSGLHHGVYWLYASDTSRNISEPEAFTIMGVGIESGMFERFRIYPNPVETHLIIETSISEPKDLEITGLNGQLLYKGQMEGTSHQLDLSTFHNGVYFITIRSKDFITTRKILKLP